MQLFAHQEMKGRGSVIGYEPSLFTTAVLNINTSCLNSDDFQVNIYAKMVTKEGGEERTSGLTRLTWRLTRQTRLTWRLTCRTAHNTLAENGFEMKGPPRHLDATGGEQERGDWSTDYLLNGRLTSTTAESNTVLSKRASPKGFLAVLRG